MRDDYVGQRVAIGFVYFDYRDNGSQSLDNVVASLLRQIASQKSVLPKSLVELYSKFKDQDRKPQIQDLELTLLDVCQDFDQVFIAIDALDECDEGMRRKHFLLFLATLQQTPRIRLFVSSRPHPKDIRRALNPAPQVAVQASDADLRKYLRRRIEESDNADIIDEDFRQHLIETVAKRAQKMYAGQFLLVAVFMLAQRLTFDLGSCYQLCRFILLSVSPLLERWKMQSKLCRMTCIKPSTRHSQESKGSQMVESDLAWESYCGYLTPNVC